MDAITVGPISARREVLFFWIIQLHYATLVLMSPTTLETPSKAEDLLAHGEEVLGLSLCYHDRRGNSGLPKSRRIHLHPGCETVRRGRPAQRCLAFCANQVHRELTDLPTGRIHRCPHGLTEIAVPVHCASHFAGVLFAGPCWLGPGACPAPALPCPPARGWLEARWRVVQALAIALGALLTETEARRGQTPTRREQILEFIRRRLDQPLRIGDLAAELALSTSRTSHLVNQLFAQSFPNLVNAMKLEQATHLLSASDLSIAVVAQRLGYSDPNYFSRLFAKAYGQSPTAYRAAHPFEA